MPFRIVPIVEGHGEVQAVPELLRRLIAEFNPAVPIDISPAIRRPRGTLAQLGGLEAAVAFAAGEIDGGGVILVVLDSEGECPAELAPQLLTRAQGARLDKRISLVLAHQEFEAWFLAAASSLKGRRGLSDQITDHQNPESVRGCKEWLERWMAPASKYSETVDQAALAAIFDLDLARRAPSFDKFCREVKQIFEYAASTAPH